MSSLTSGILGYAIAQTTGPRCPAVTNVITENGTQGSQYGTSEDVRNAVKELRLALSSKDAVSTDTDDLHNHGVSEWDHRTGKFHPSVVVYPNSTEDVVQIVKIATKYRTPIIVQSGVTSFEGQCRITSLQGICVDLCMMDRILEIHEADSDLVCQPGARWMEVNDHLKQKGIPLFFPLDPGPGATLGGMLSTGCSGTNAMRYGTAKGEWFLNATVVLPSGEVIKTRRRSRKSSAGFDTTKLFIGAEGTLGIVTEVTIRLAPVLPTTTAVVQFPDILKASEAVIDVMNQGVGIQCIELLDKVSMFAVNMHASPGRKWAEKDSLFFKFQGHSQAALQETAKVVKTIVEKHGGTRFELARDEEDAEAMWNDRRNAYSAGLAFMEGGRGTPTDVCVPVSRLPELVYETKKDFSELGITSPIVGHAGDGNFHSLPLFRTEDEEAVVKEAVRRMVHRAIALDGTCTGEHGVGLEKKEYLVEELGLGTVELMKTIKRAIDPLGLFNPGKLYPDTAADKKDKQYVK